MAAEDGSNGAWYGDTKSCCSTFITSSICESAEQMLGGTGTTNVCGFHRCTNVLE